MPIKRTAAIILNAEGKVVSPSDISQSSNISTGQASQELMRLVNMGIAVKKGRGKYALLDIEKTINFLNNKTQQNTTKDTIGGTMQAPKVLVRPHRIWFKAKVNNEPTIEGAIKCGVTRLGEWRVWTPNQNSAMYEKLIQLPRGNNATVRYAWGTKKRTITVKCEDVLVNGEELSDHMRDIWDSVEQALRKISREDCFQIGLIQLSCDNHFAIGLPVDKGWQLPPPGIIKINEFWWLDSSTGWPEIETHLQAQAKRLVELPDKVDSLPSDIRIAIREELRDLLGNKEEHTKRPIPEVPEGVYA